MERIRKAVTLVILAALAFTGPCFADMEGGNGEKIPAADICISVEHVMLGDRYTGKDGFSFVLEALDPASPMPEGAVNGRKEIEIRGEGEASFGDMVFERPDAYRYRVYSSSEKSGTVRSKKSYIVTVTKLNDGTANMVINDEASGEKPEKILFTDEYKAPKRSIPKTDDPGFETLLYAADIFAASAALMLLMLAMKKRNEER